MERGEHSESALRAAGGVRGEYVGVGGRVHIGVAAQNGMPDDALHMHAERAVVAVVAAVAVGGHSQHNDTWVDFAHHIVGYAELVHRFGDVVLNECVADGDEALEDVNAAWLEQIHGDAQFVAPVRVEEGVAVPWAGAGFAAGHSGYESGQPLNDLFGRVGHIAARDGRQPPDGFQADDLRAHIGEQRGAVCSRPYHGHVQDAYALKRQFCHMLASLARSCAIAVVMRLRRARCGLAAISMIKSASAPAYAIRAAIPLPPKRRLRKAQPSGMPRQTALSCKSE